MGYECGTMYFQKRHSSLLKGPHQNSLRPLFLAGLASPRTGSSITALTPAFPPPLADTAPLTARLFFAGDARPGTAPSSLSPADLGTETLLPNDGGSMRGTNDLMPGIPENVVADGVFLGVLRFCTDGVVGAPSLDAAKFSLRGAGRERVFFAAVCSGFVCDDGTTSGGRREVVDDSSAFAGVAMRDLRFGAGAAAFGFASPAVESFASVGSVVDGVGRVRRDRVLVGDNGGASVVIGF